MIDLPITEYRLLLTAYRDLPNTDHQIPQNSCPWSI